MDHLELVLSRQTSLTSNDLWLAHGVAPYIRRRIAIGWRNVTGTDKNAAALAQW